MTSTLDKHILMFLLAAIGLIVLPHIYHIPLVLFGFFFLLLSWRFIGLWQPRYLANNSVIFLLTVCAIALLYSQHQTW